MQVIILAAGMGRRLGELTHDNTKCMVKVNGVRLIDRLLQQLVSAPCSLYRIVIVIGYEGKKLKEYLGDSFQDIPLEYVENPIYDKTNNISQLYTLMYQSQNVKVLITITCLRYKVTKSFVYLLATNI